MLTDKKIANDKERLLSLKDGWDGDPDNKAFNPAFVERVAEAAQRMLDGTGFRPILFPDDHDEIDVEIHARKFDILATFGDDGTGGVYAREKQNGGKEVEVDGTCADVEATIIKFINDEMAGKISRLRRNSINIT